MSKRNVKGGRGKKPYGNRTKEKKYTEASATKDANIDRCDISHDNDPSWYGSSPKLLGDAGKISFNNPAGLPINLSPDLTADGLWNSHLSSVRFPGIMTYDIVTGPGVSHDNSSAVNVAARNLYSYIRHANSGHANYDSPDLMLYLLAADNAYMWYAHLIRLYGTMMLYVTGNRYYPKALVAAQGFNFEDLIEHIADLRFVINRYVKQIGSLCVPAELSLFKRHNWLYSNYFLDEDTVKAHMYLFRPAGFHIYNETAGAGKLDWVDYDKLGNQTAPTPWKDFEDIVHICNIITASLMESEDIGIMSGDILKAYGNDKLLTLSMIPEDFTVVPSYSPEVLTQIHNASIVSGTNHTSLNITQDVETGALLWVPSAFANNAAQQVQFEAACSENKLIDMPMSDPTPDDVMVATRLMATGYESPYGDILCGTEFVSSASIVSYNSNGSLETKAIENGGKTNSSLMAKMSMFHHHPTVYTVYYNGGDPSSTNFSDPAIWVTLENYTNMSQSDLLKLHEVAVLSEFNVPQMGLYTP